MKSCILAFESSCDETAIAVVSSKGEVCFQALSSQIDLHKKYGGVVPEVASRAHSDELSGLLNQAMNFLADNKDTVQIKKVAATAGPGLMGPLLVSHSCARGVAFAMGVPFEGVHHLRGHLASVLLSSSDRDLNEVAGETFPAWVVLVSGGHTQILHCQKDLSSEILATTADDAAGECFDKSAKMMGLSYPGGPAIEALASQLESQESLVRAEEFSAQLPRPRSQTGFSFSGLKTAIRLMLEKDGSLRQAPEFCWAIQDAITDSLLKGMNRCLKEHQDLSQTKKLVFCGGVSANRYLREKLENWAASKRLELVLPPLKYCTDNAAMIAAAAWVQAPEHVLTEVKARIPLAPTHFRKGKQA